MGGWVGGFNTLCNYLCFRGWGAWGVQAFLQLFMLPQNPTSTSNLNQNIFISKHYAMFLTPPFLISKHYAVFLCDSSAACASVQTWILSIIVVRGHFLSRGVFWNSSNIFGITLRAWGGRNGVLWRFSGFSGGFSGGIVTCSWYKTFIS